MRRFPAILVLLAVAAVGSGALRYVHELQHAHAAGHGHGRHHDHAPAAPAHHDESKCLIHALLKLPMLGGAQAALLVLVGPFVAFVATPAAPVLCRRPVLALDSRGPPVG